MAQGVKSFERLIQLKWWKTGPVLYQNARIILRDAALDTFNAAAAAYMWGGRGDGGLLPRSYEGARARVHREGRVRVPDDQASRDEEGARCLRDAAPRGRAAARVARRTFSQQRPPSP